jgi:voltage-gated potassium channel Kch
MMALCVMTHAVGVTVAARRLSVEQAARFGQWVWVFIRLAWLIVFLHLVEITLWAGLYLWREALPDLQSAIYFSAVTYTTTGYGDLVLPMDWRLVGAVEALTGILLCSWSAGFFFAVVSQIVSKHE